MSRKPRLLLVDDHPVLREGIRSYLSSHGLAEIVGEAANGAEAMRQARALKPDLVLMDINLPDVSGFVVTERLRRELPAVRVLIVTMHESLEYSVQAMRSGACGYLLKAAKPDAMAAAIQTVYAGETHFSPEAVRAKFDDWAKRKNPADSAALLSPRERFVLARIAQGQTSRSIAAELGVKERTVNTHRERLMAKTGIHKAAELTRYAIKNKLLKPGAGHPTADRAPGPRRRSPKTAAVAKH